jgi:hypothetical protein
MAKMVHSTRAIRSRKGGASRAKGGKLAHVTIARPRAKLENVDMKAVRKALREYFLTHPHALE